MNNLKITIGGVEYTIKQSFRALMIFEQMTKKSSTKIEENVSDIFTMFYAMVKANNKDFKLTFDDFIDEVDNGDGNVFDEFTNYLQALAASNNDDTTSNNIKKK